MVYTLLLITINLLKDGNNISVQLCYTRKRVRNIPANIKNNGYKQHEHNIKQQQNVSLAEPANGKIPPSEVS